MEHSKDFTHHLNALNNPDRHDEKYLEQGRAYCRAYLDGYSFGAANATRELKKDLFG